MDSSSGGGTPVRQLKNSVAQRRKGRMPLFTVSATVNPETPDLNLRERERKEEMDDTTPFLIFFLLYDSIRYFLTHQCVETQESKVLLRPEPHLPPQPLQSQHSLSTHNHYCQHESPFSHRGLCENQAWVWGHIPCVVSRTCSMCPIVTKCNMWRWLYAVLIAEGWRSTASSWYNTGIDRTRPTWGEPLPFITGQKVIECPLTRLWNCFTTLLSRWKIISLVTDKSNNSLVFDWFNDKLTPFTSYRNVLVFNQ